MTCNICIHEKVCPHLREEDATRCKQFADKGEYVKVGKYKKKYSTTSTKKTVGQIIFEKRKINGWTKKKLAEKIDVSPSTISAWEYGNFYPNAIYLVSLADEFDCTIDELCGREVKNNE